MVSRSQRRNMDWGNVMEQDGVLIEEVKSLPVLYDTRRSDYRLTRARDEAWHTVARQVGRPVEECKRRFKSLRDRYVKETRRGTSHTWALAEPLHFLSEHVKSRASGESGVAFNPDETEDSREMYLTLAPDARPNTSSNLQANSGDDLSSPSSPLPEVQIVGQKRKAKEALFPKSFQDEIMKVLEEDTDEDRLFALSLVPALKKLREEEKSLAKVKIQLLLHELQFGKITD